MCESKDKKKLFLSSQQFSVLTGSDDPRRRRFFVCGGKGATDEKDERANEDPWQPLGRDKLHANAAGPTPPKRVALVCGAGLGKTTNMTWLAAQFCAKDRSIRQVPLLLRLDDPKDQRVLRKERQLGKRANALVKRLLQRVRDVNDRDIPLPDDRPDRLPAMIRRLQSEGRITVLIDGLDHALSNTEIATDLQEMLDSKQWRRCPVWIAGRPEAFAACWDKVFVDARWEFLRVDPLAEADIRFYLKREAGGDWFDVIPPEGRWLLAIPRMLGLISGILRTAIERSARDQIDATEVIRRLKLHTAADVYYRAYFELGMYGDVDSQGLLAQGLLKDTEAAWIGLKKLARAHPYYEEPSEENLEDRLQRTSVLLGAIAFEEFGMHLEAKLPEPITAGVRLRTLRKQVAAKLEAAGQGTGPQFVRDLRRLRHMNNHTLEHLLFREANAERLLWENCTVQAFFAAHWAMTHAAPADREKMKRQVVDGKLLAGFDEFWQFASEMPDQALRRDGKLDASRWLEVFAPCYGRWQEQKHKQDVEVRWDHQMIYHSFDRMKTRSPETIKTWRASFEALPRGTKIERRIYGEIVGGFKPIPASKCQYGADPLADPPLVGVIRQVAAFRMHQYAVTNEMYELFDPSHKRLRWDYHGHPWAKQRKGGDDRCSVVNVSWYDAWCYAKWVGKTEVGGEVYEVALPTELQWEHACRAESKSAWFFGDDETELRKFAHYGQSWITGSTRPVDEQVGDGPARLANPHGLHDMPGNVREWCDDRWEPGASARVLRGGSWGNHGGYCRSAYRDWDEPEYQSRRIGFRVAAVPVVGAKLGKCE